MPTLLKRYTPLLIPCAVLAVFIGASFLYFSPNELIRTSREGGPIENLTAIFFAFAAAAGVFAAWRYKAPDWNLYAIFMVAAGLREMGAHKTWTTMSIFKSRFYVSPDVPLIEKVAGAIVIFILLYAIFKVLRKYTFASIQQALAGNVYVLWIYGGLGLYAVAKGFDTFFRTFPYFEDTRTSFEHFMFYAEESMEMGGAFLLMMVPVLYIYRHKKASR